MRLRVSKVQIEKNMRLSYTYLVDFKEHLKDYLNEDEIEQLCASFGQKEHKGLVLNVDKLSPEMFEKMFPNVKRHPVVENAYLFDPDEYSFGKMIYHELGCYYIQDPSATLVSYFLDAKANMEVLDMCAAPGGKTISTSLLSEEKSLIYSNDLSSSRCSILLDNIERMGLKNVVVLNTDLSKIKNLENKFDAIILDAPCSGSGMFNKLEAMRDDWTFEKVKKASIIQKELIMLAYSFLKEGGRLIYSTCSYSKLEDEDVINHLLSHSSAKLVPIKDYPGFYRSKVMKEAIHLFPHLFPGEGHFIALVEKPGDLLPKRKVEEYHSFRKGLDKGKSIIEYHFSLPFSPIMNLEKISIRPGLFTTYKKNGEEFVSYQYSHALNSNGSYPLNEDELKKYLHGETLSTDSKKQYKVVSFEGINVGPCYTKKGIIKNLYPKKLRH